ncbi:hypothetical protein RvY_00487 [Ramazzottius varieornatus]|uniref:Uncharacterized protein n=1 Tax=Ramazzottius varieornatus TaxID=947166 RepID=A0A1D1UMV6_RAMVA|nr:hypothetical protein RvY_00487 [Ramazzottius varieornatus]
MDLSRGFFFLSVGLAVVMVFTVRSEAKLLQKLLDNARAGSEDGLEDSGNSRAVEQLDRSLWIGDMGADCQADHRAGAKGVLTAKQR